MYSAIHFHNAYSYSNLFFFFFPLVKVRAGEHFYRCVGPWKCKQYNAVGTFFRHFLLLIFTFNRNYSKKQVLKTVRSI